MKITQQICDLYDEIGRMEYRMEELKSWRKLFFFPPFSWIIDNKIELLKAQIKAEKERLERLFKFQRNGAGLKAKALISNLEQLERLQKKGGEFNERRI